MTCIARLLDRVHAWLYRRRYDAHVRELRRRARAAGMTMVVVLLSVDVTGGLLALPGCAHRQRVRTIDAIEARCVAELDAATDEVAVLSITDRCHREISEVTDAD